MRVEGKQIGKGTNRWKKWGINDCKGGRYDGFITSMYDMKPIILHIYYAVMK